MLSPESERYFLYRLLVADASVRFRSCTLETGQSQLTTDIQHTQRGRSLVHSKSCNNHVYERAMIAMTCLTFPEMSDDGAGSLQPT